MNIFSKFTLFTMAAATLPAAAAPYTVAAASADAGAVVLAAADGQLQRLRRGDTVPQSAWRLSEIRAGRATFTRPLPDSGRAISISAAPGDTIDFSDLDQRQAQAAEAAPAVESHIIVNRARTR
ncbi:MAG: hypothetical protein AMXMBFR59_23840 [Rhodanobacteraceae bacterium]